ncbi:hypothetical protein SODALDRAFT_138466 [Sodiomyces alkalinus F11]|uniref:Uncharacterized protein n=1 Tax=Sodiomyces alkalinus (strain CBS 110278 / VKM F-3762 / F11) TaxID=1314773 RepID=A0A3N2PZF6_SODAK|nr:hypothetical protein SODALDRAFT_138466 [Sodiomyces alkalinus F11]ROT39816.1 hypothetical protein SODALDRAFT_138466 [Sodiomyces alkalinus F11]
MSDGVMDPYLVYTTMPYAASHKPGPGQHCRQTAKLVYFEALLTGCPRESTRRWDEKKVWEGLFVLETWVCLGFGIWDFLVSG